MHIKPIDWLASITLGLALVGAAACDDPAAGKPQAQVASAQPTSAEASKPGASPSAATREATATPAWKIDAGKSKIEFVGSKVTGKHEGGFKSFTGEVKLAGGKIEGASVSVEIDMGSVYSDAEKLTGHLKSADFFDVEKHPKASFASTDIKAGGKDGATHTVTGNLTLHGVTKSVSFPATISVSGDQATVKTELSINRKDFGIVYAGMADDLIRDDVVIKLDLKVAK